GRMCSQQWLASRGHPPRASLGCIARFDHAHSVLTGYHPSEVVGRDPARVAAPINLYLRSFGSGIHRKLSWNYCDRSWNTNRWFSISVAWLHYWCHLRGCSLGLSGLVRPGKTAGGASWRVSTASAVGRSGDPRNDSFSGGSSSRSEKLTRFLAPGASPAIMGSTANLGIVARRSVVTAADILPSWCSKYSADSSTDELTDCRLQSR